MIGLGKWQADVKSMFFSGTAILDITDNSGEYGMALELPGQNIDIPEIKILESEEDGDILNLKAEVSILPKKTIDVSLVFEGDTLNGSLKIPFIGKIKINDAVKVG